MIVYIDDGSTNVKLMWEENGTWHQHISTNSFSKNWAPAFGASKPFNYTIGNDTYCYDRTSPSALATNNVAWQYSDLNTLAIQHALQTSGIKPQELDVIVTLPLCEFFNHQSQLNTANIDRKKASVSKPVTVNDREVFTFSSVKVRPESIPAGTIAGTEYGLTDQHVVLLVDIGGTTLDIAMVRGDMSEVIKIYGDAQVGVSTVTANTVRALDAAKTPTSARNVDIFIQNRDDLDFISDRLNISGAASDIRDAIYAGMTDLSDRVIAALRTFSGYSHIILVGGGAPLVIDAISAADLVREDRCLMVADPQTALVRGIKSGV